jgi:hypothetical protein
MSRGNSLNSYHKQTRISFFSFTKPENRRVDQNCWGVLVPVGWGRRWGKGVGDEYSANTVGNGKMRPMETAPGVGEGRLMEG